MSDPDQKLAGNSGANRRAPTAMLDALALVKLELQASRASDLGMGADDYANGLTALTRLEDALTSNASLASEPSGWRGLTAAPENLFVALVGVDRFIGMDDDLGRPGVNTTMEVLCHRIRLRAPNVILGRINRSSIEFTFHAENFDAAEATLIALQCDLEAPIGLADRPFSVDVAIGFAGRATAQDDLEALVDRAEHALAKARAGHVKVSAFTDQDRADRVERMALMRDLRLATANDELSVHYQPKLNVRAGAITSMEALVRWRHAERGFVPPDKFIPLAEESGEIGPLTEQVIRKAIDHSDRLLAAGHAIRVDVNISGVLIADPCFADTMLKAVKGRETRFGFEITETAVIANPEKALAHIGAFSAAGIAIAIDDYGSGLSSLSYLKQIPADELKIDKAFVSGLTTSHRDPLLVRSTIDLAHALGMAVTAEGVDNAMSLALLKVMGCDMVQGYQISKPLPFDQVLDFLNAFSSGVVETPEARPARL